MSDPDHTRTRGGIGESFEVVMAAARANAGWAFARLHEELAPRVAGYLRAHGAQEPDDLTSEVFLGVFRNLDDFTGDESMFRSWVFTIAHRRLIDERRREGRRPRIEPLESSRHERATPEAEPAAVVEQGDDVARAMEFVDRLTPKQRDVILLRIIAELPVAEVAEVLGMRQGAVRAQQHRALSALRRMV